MAQTGGHGKLLLGTLIGLTVISGLVDAVSYLGLGHVFTANMTGTVVLLGFSRPACSGFSAAACLTSLGSFLGPPPGALPVGSPRRRQLLAVAMSIEAVATAAAAAVAFGVAHVSQGWPRYTIIAALAFAWGCVTPRSGGSPFPT